MVLILDSECAIRNYVSYQLDHEIPQGKFAWPMGPIMLEFD